MVKNTTPQKEADNRRKTLFKEAAANILKETERPVSREGLLQKIVDKALENDKGATVYQVITEYVSARMAAMLADVLIKNELISRNSIDQSPAAMNALTKYATQNYNHLVLLYKNNSLPDINTTNLPGFSETLQGIQEIGAKQEQISKTLFEAAAANILKETGKNVNDQQNRKTDLQNSVNEALKNHKLFQQMISGEVPWTGANIDVVTKALTKSVTDNYIITRASLMIADRMSKEKGVPASILTNDKAIMTLIKDNVRTNLDRYLRYYKDNSLLKPEAPLMNFPETMQIERRIDNYKKTLPQEKVPSAKPATPAQTKTTPPLSEPPSPVSPPIPTKTTPTPVLSKPSSPESPPIPTKTTTTPPLSTPLSPTFPPASAQTTTTPPISEPSPPDIGAKATLWQKFKTFINKVAEKLGISKKDEVVQNKTPTPSTPPTSPTSPTLSTPTASINRVTPTQTITPPGKTVSSTSSSPTKPQRRYSTGNMPSPTSTAKPIQRRYSASNIPTLGQRRNNTSNQRGKGGGMSL